MTDGIRVFCGCLYLKYSAKVNACADVLNYGDISRIEYAKIAGDELCHFLQIQKMNW